jgi:hypothetical protein
VITSDTPGVFDVIMPLGREHAGHRAARTPHPAEPHHAGPRPAERRDHVRHRGAYDVIMPLGRRAA